MVIKLKFEIDTQNNNRDIKIKNDSGKGVIELTVANNYLVGLKSDNTTVIKGTDSFNHGGTGLQLNAVTKVNLTLNSIEEAEKFVRLVILREKEKDTTATNTDKGKTVIVLKGLSIDDTTLNVKTKNTNELDLDDTSFDGGSFTTAGNLSIDICTDKHGGGTDVVPKDFDGDAKPLTNYTTALNKLENDLKVIRTKYTLAADLKSINIAADITALNDYWVKAAGAASPEKSLYELDHVKIIDDGGADKDGRTYYKNEIDM